MVQHLQIFDYICLSGTTNDRMIEYVDQQHEQFENPVVVVNGKYKIPNVNKNKKIFFLSLTSSRTPLPPRKKNNRN